MKVLVTGAGGFIGRHLCKVLAGLYPCDVMGFIRSEDELQRRRRLDDGKVSYAYGDIRDVLSVKTLLGAVEVDVIVHLAALKHIDVCDEEPYDATMTNIQGTLNLLEHFKGSRFIYMSTDKAVYPSSVYGATKLLCEHLVLGWGGGFTKAVVRSGNAFGSDGSVVDYWAQQIKAENRMDVTEPDMTRYFIGVDDLCWFIAGVLGRRDTGIFVPAMKAVRVGYLCDVMNKLLARGKAETRLVGMRCGEKWHEQLYSPRDRNLTVGKGVPITSDEAERATESDILAWWEQANE